MQCESDLTFQRGQVQQSYIGIVCAQLQRHLSHYLASAPGWQAVPGGVGPGAVHLVLTLVEVQADLLQLAPPTCITQVRTSSSWSCSDLLCLLLMSCRAHHSKTATAGAMTWPSRG